MPPAPPSPAEARALFEQSLHLIHTQPGERGLIHAELSRWHTLFSQATGVDAFQINATPSIHLPSGRAIGASAAAFCLLEGQRTAVFLRGIESAIRDLQHLFPGERIRILYAGCGPYASLLTPLTARLSADEVGWHLLDVNQHSLESAQRLHHALGLTSWLLGAELADASTYTMPTDEPFHLVLSETMQSALYEEPQLAIMLNLLPQIQPHALFLPQRIAINAAVVRWLPAIENDAPQSTTQDLGPIYTAGRLPAEPPHETHITVPTLDTPGTLSLTTTITVYKDEILSGSDTSITLPRSLRRQLHGGERLAFHYQWQPLPAFVCTLDGASPAQNDARADFSLATAPNLP